MQQEITILKQQLKGKDQEILWIAQKQKTESSEIKDKNQQIQRQYEQQKNNQQKLSQTHQNEMVKLRQENEKLRKQYENLLSQLKMDIFGTDFELFTKSVSFNANERSFSPTKRQENTFRQTPQTYNKTPKNTKEFNQIITKLNQSEQNLENTQKALQKKESEYNTILKTSQDKCYHLERLNQQLKAKLEILINNQDTKRQLELIYEQQQKSQLLQRRLEDQLKIEQNILQQREELKRKCDDQLRDNKELIKQKQLLVIENGNLKSNQGSQSNSVSQMDVKLKEKEKEITTLQKEINQLKNDLSNQQQMSLNEENKTVQDQRQELKTLVQSKDDICDKLKKENENLKLELERAVSLQQQGEKNLQEEQNQRQTISKSYEILKQEFVENQNSDQKSIENLNSNIDVLNNKIKEITSKPCQECFEKVNEISHLKQEYEQNISQQETKFQSPKPCQECLGKVNEMSHLKQEYEQIISQQETKFQSPKQCQECLEKANEIPRLKKEYEQIISQQEAKFQSQMVQLKQQKNNNEKEREMPKILIPQSFDSGGGLSPQNRTSLRTLQSKIRNSEIVNQELIEQLDSYTGGQAAKDQYILKLKQTNKQQNDEIQFCNLQIDKLKMEVKGYEQNIQAKYTEVDQLSKKLEQGQLLMQKEIIQINDQKEKIIEENSLRFKIEKEELVAQMQQIKNENVALKNELELVSSQLKTLELAQRGKDQQDIGQLQQQIKKEFEERILKLTADKLQSEKLSEKQIQILQKKLGDLQEDNSKRTLELQKSKGSRRTSQVQQDQMTVKLQEKELKIQLLQKNLIETKQSYEALADKAKEMNQKNKSLKEKMSKAHTLLNKIPVIDKETNEPKEELDPFAWDLVITNEQETLSSLTVNGWEFAKGSSSPMTPYSRHIFVFSFDPQLLVSIINPYFLQHITQQANPLELLTAQLLVKILQDTCVTTKLLSKNVLAGMTCAKGSGEVEDNLDHQLWDEIWIDYAQQECDCLVFAIKDLNYIEEEVINSMIRINPANFIILVQQGPKQSQIMDYIRQKFVLVEQKSEQETIYFSNNRIVLASLNSPELNVWMNRAKCEDEKLFLDQFKSFVTRNCNKIFSNTTKPSIKIQKLLASNTFNYFVQLTDRQLSQKRQPIILNTMAPMVSINKNENGVIEFKLKIKGKVVLNVLCKIAQLAKHNKVHSSQINLKVVFKDKVYLFEQVISYVSQVPYILIEQFEQEIKDGYCIIKAQIQKD